MTAAPCWTVFVAGEDERAVRELAGGVDGRVTRYRLEAVVPVAGAVPSGLAPGQTVVRLESAAPITVRENMAGDRVWFHGVTQHLSYTGRAARDLLNERSRDALPPSPATSAVLIPIAKSATWWHLAQDERQTYFERGGGHDGHTAIGLPYVDRIFRRLYHCRYAGGPGPYDFLTYFEFHASHRGDFERLLSELRDPDRNPEWTFVAREFEAWMTKVA